MDKRFLLWILYLLLFFLLRSASSSAPERNPIGGNPQFEVAQVTKPSTIREGPRFSVVLAHIAIICALAVHISACRRNGGGCDGGHLSFLIFFFGFYKYVYYLNISIAL